MLSCTSAPRARFAWRKALRLEREEAPALVCFQPANCQGVSCPRAPGDGHEPARTNHPFLCSCSSRPRCSEPAVANFWLRVGEARRGPTARSRARGRLPAVPTSVSSPPLIFRHCGFCRPPVTAMKGFLVKKAPDVNTV